MSIKEIDVVFFGTNGMTEDELKMRAEFELKKIFKVENKWNKMPDGITLMDESPEEITSRITGKSCVLNPDAISVYDFIMGWNLQTNYFIKKDSHKTYVECVKWFFKLYPKEAKIILGSIKNFKCQGVN